MNFLNKLERKWGKHAIPNLTMYLIICYAAGYILEFMNPSILTYLTLNPYAILHGQIWRLVTWVIMPPEKFGFFTLIMLYFYYSIGRSLETVWGTFRYNVFLFSGMLFTIIGAFLLLGFYALQPQLVLELTGSAVKGVGGVNQATTLMLWMQLISRFFSTHYICLSLFLAYAITFPEMRVLFMMIVPIKVKVLGIVYVVMLGFQILTTFGTMLFTPTLVSVLSSLANVMIFYLITRKGFKSPKQIKRQHMYKREINKVTSITKHKCAICGRTEIDSPDMAFRFCSKCDGNYEYCEEHLYTHKHVTKEN